MLADTDDKERAGLCSRLEVDVVIWLQSMPVLKEQFHKRYD
jgi:hypothetical protein